VQREKDEAIRYANMDLLERLIQILDNFEYGLTAARQSPEGGAILSGMEMVGKQLQDFLKQTASSRSRRNGQKFDPHLPRRWPRRQAKRCRKGT